MCEGKKPSIAIVIITIITTTTITATSVTTGRGGAGHTPTFSGQLGRPHVAHLAVSDYVRPFCTLITKTLTLSTW